MHIETIIQTRFCDTDKNGHINNTAINQWLEVGRVDLGFNNFPKRPTVLIRRVDTEFLYEMMFPDETVLLTGVDRLGTTSITLYQELWQNDRCCVKALCVEVWYDKKTRKSAPIPNEYRRIYESFMFGNERA